MATRIYYPKSKKKLKEQRQQQLRRERTEAALAAGGTTDDKDDSLILKEDVEKSRQNIADSASIREKWRKIEDSALASVIRMCIKIKGKIEYTKSTEAETTKRMTAVYKEFNELLTAIQQVLNEVTASIFEDQEQTEKYYSKVFPMLLELWSACAMITVDLFVQMIQIFDSDSTEKRVLKPSDEDLELVKTIVKTCMCSAKMTTLAANITDHPVPESLQDKVLTFAVDQSRKYTDSLSKLAQAGFKTPCRETEEDILEMVEWMLFSLNHMTTTVIQPLSSPDTEETENKDDTEKSKKKADSASMQNLNGALNTLFESLDKLESEVCIEKDKNGQEEGENSNTEPFSECSKAISHLEKRFQAFSDALLDSGKVTISQEDPSGSDAKIYFRPELYLEVAKYSIGPCNMSDRNTWLMELPLTSDHQLISDIYVVQNGPLKTSSPVEVDFTIVPMPSFKNKKIHMKAKIGVEWITVEDVQQEISESDAHISFKTENLEAFVAYIELSSVAVEVTPEGYTYTCDTNNDIQVAFPKGTVTDTQTFKIKVVPCDAEEVRFLKENFPDAIMGILAVSDAVEIYSDPDVTLKEQTTVQLPFDDDDGPDTSLVVIRYNGTNVQVLDKSQCHVKKEKNTFTVESKGIWSFAIAKIKRIFLNMRDTIKREFLVMFGKVHLCNICTFIDDTQRNIKDGSFYFWIECIDKYRIQTDVEVKRKAGLIEVKNSRSKDVAISQNETIKMTITGQVKVLDPDPPESFKITFLLGADNHLNIPMEVHRENDRPPYASLTFCENESEKFLHSVNVPVRDLSELPSDEITARHLSKNGEVNSARDEFRKKEEAARHILSHESLMALAREMTENEVTELGMQMGVPEERIMKFKDTYEGDTVRINFLILCDWRGKSARATMVDFLVSSLKTTRNREMSAIVERVRNKGRALVKDDFK